MQSRLIPVHQCAIRCVERTGNLGCDQANHDIRPVSMVALGGEYNSRAYFGHLHTSKGTYNNVARFQSPSRSKSAKWLNEDLAASARSSSVQASDQSTGRPAPRSAKWRAQSKTFAASSRGRARTTLISDFSCVVRTISSF